MSYCAAGQSEQKTANILMLSIFYSIHMNLVNGFSTSQCVQCSASLYILDITWFMLLILITKLQKITSDVYIL